MCVLVIASLRFTQLSLRDPEHMSSGVYVCDSCCKRVASPQFVRTGQIRPEGGGRGGETPQLWDGCVLDKGKEQAGKSW